MTKKLSFTEWKARQVDADSSAAGVWRMYRERQWYHTAYGKYISSSNA